jgi:hypothetical protein
MVNVRVKPWGGLIIPYRGSSHRNFLEVISTYWGPHETNTILRDILMNEVEQSWFF